jgi:hypothetical protein
MRHSWRSLRGTVVAVAFAAVAMNGFRELPRCFDCYLFWQGVARADRDVELAARTSGLDSGNGRRAALNAQQSREQFQAIMRERLPSLVSAGIGLVTGFLLLWLVVGSVFRGGDGIIGGRTTEKANAT